VAIIDFSTIVKLLGKFGFEKNYVRAFDRKTQLGLANPSWVCDTKNVPVVSMSVSISVSISQSAVCSDPESDIQSAYFVFGAMKCDWLLTLCPSNDF
jgi:hypothetical protein